MKEKKSSFTGSLGFVLAAAGSAVGVGNIWRFPYLCAKDGGGLFLIVYLILVLTFGFVLLTTDIAIGRKTKQNALKAFGTLHSKWRFLGYVSCACADHDVLFCYRRLDHEIFLRVCGVGWIGAYGGFLFYLLYYVKSSSDRVYAAVPGADGVDCIQRRGKRN